MISKRMTAMAVAMLTATIAFAQTAAGREFTVAFSSSEIEFNPHHSIYSHEAQLFTGIYEGLFTYNPSSLEPVKSAVQRYTRSQDGKTYTFYLRKEAAWSDGTPVTAAHFRDAWLRMIDPATKADYAAFFDVISGARDFRLGTSADASKVGVSVIADDVLQVRLESPAPYFTRLLCHHSFAPVHPSMLAKRDWSKDPASIPANGPYFIKSYDVTGMLLEKNPKYWDAASIKVDRVRIFFIEDELESTARYNGGGIDWLAGSIDIETLLNAKAIQVNPMFATNYWFFDCSKAPWSDSRVRRALQLLVPWSVVRDKEFYLMPARELVLPLEGYKGARGIDKQDAEAAKGLLAEAGFPEGKGLPPVVILIPEGEDARRIADAMKSGWEPAGLVVDIQTLPANRFYQATRSKPFTVSITSWIGDFADPLAFLQMWTSDSNLNTAGYSDPAYDALIALSMSEQQEQRMATLAKAEQLLLDGGAVMPIYHQLAVNILDAESVLGWYRNALDIHPFKYIEFGTPKALPNVVMAR
ncbi:MAG: peptide ABC transporter substrate-binding protein [Spirochaetes bacterium]|nr:peptide ABC transporter substrate-binding protein [Spirochaetota bacterium]